MELCDFALQNFFEVRSYMFSFIHVVVFWSKVGIELQNAESEEGKSLSFHSTPLQYTIPDEK